MARFFLIDILLFFLRGKAKVLLAILRDSMTKTLDKTKSCCFGTNKEAKLLAAGARRRKVKIFHETSGKSSKKRKFNEGGNGK